MGVDAIPADSHRRKTHPTDRLGEHLGIFHARQNDALRSRVEQTAHQRIKEFGYPDDRRDAILQGDLIMSWTVSRVERAVLEIDENIIEAGGRKGPADFGRPVDLQAASKHRFASDKPLPCEIRAHVLTIS